MSTLTLDLTEAVEAAASKYWERLSRDVSWADATPVVRHELREQVTPLVAAAADVLMDAFRDQVGIQRTIDATKRELAAVGSPSGLDADAAARVTDPASLALLIDCDGWGGLMQVRTDLVATISDTGTTPWPLVRWDIPLPRAGTLLNALDALDEIAEVLAATNGEGPNGWEAERVALAEALEHLVRTGRAARTDSGHLTLPPPEGDHPL